MGATFSQEMLSAPKLRWCDAITDLLDFSIITYAVDPVKLAMHLPADVTPDVRTLDDGREVAMISAVPFRDKGFHFKGLPFIRMSMGQINYRAYVIYQGKPCVWFFGTSLTGPTVVIPHYLWRIPWHAASMRFDVKWEDNRCLSYSLESKSKWGNASLRLKGSDSPMARVDGFTDEEESRVILTHPLKGLYYRLDGKVGSYSVWHDKLDLYQGEVESARFEVFESRGLIDAESKPHSVLLMPKTTFIVQLPPVVVG